ncbi:MAG: Crp/Fnr family transcriptional regulator [Bacteroidales bacterium]|nr:Crp/Fnr family transcriptional regulator [Bacteroidales bacterium]
MLNRKSDQCNSCDNCNTRSPLFNLLNEEELKVMNTGRFEVIFNPGENIIKQGTSASHLIMLTHGMAKLYLEGIDKRNLILKLVPAWKLFGAPGLYTDFRYQYSVTALTESSACFIPSDNVRKIIRSSPDFAEGLLKHCNQNNADNYDRLVSLTQKQMPGRLADVLLYLSKEIHRSIAFNLFITRQEIGEMSNMTKESATRILKEFETEGVIKIETKTIEILKMETLKEISLHG